MHQVARIYKFQLIAHKSGATIFNKNAVIQRNKALIFIKNNYIETTFTGSDSLAKEGKKKQYCAIQTVFGLLILLEYFIYVKKL